MTAAHERYSRRIELQGFTSAYGSSEVVRHKYLDINPEHTLLRQARDISEELRMMLRIYRQQLDIVRNFRKIVVQMNKGPGDRQDEVQRSFSAREVLTGENLRESLTRRDEIIPENTIEAAENLVKLIEDRQSQLQDLKDAARLTSQQVCEVKKNL